MRLSYVTVCVNYLDLFRVAHHHNLSASAFDDYVVVTTTEDKETTAWTQARKEITPVYTDAFYRNGARFNKGLALAEGLNALKSICDPEWVCTMDADTFVLPDWRAQIVGTPDAPPKVKLDKEWLYGARRVLLPTWADYERLWKDDLDTFESPKGFAFGWLQLWHWQSQAFQSRIAAGELYPQGQDCTEVDWKFYLPWGDLEPGYERATGRIAELPFKVMNLGPHGANHTGRKSAPFVPPPEIDTSDGPSMGGPSTYRNA